MVNGILYSFLTSNSYRCKLAELEVELAELEVKIQDVEGSIRAEEAKPRSFFDRYIASFIESITNGLFCSSSLKKRDINQIKLKKIELENKRTALVQVVDEQYVRNRRKAVATGLIVTGALACFLCRNLFTTPDPLRFPPTKDIFNPLSLATHLVHTKEAMRHEMGGNIPSIWFKYRVLQPIFTQLGISPALEKEVCAEWQRRFDSSSNSTVFKQATDLLRKSCLSHKELCAELKQLALRRYYPKVEAAAGQYINTKEVKDIKTVPLQKDSYTTALINRRGWDELRGRIESTFNDKEHYPNNTMRELQN